jgi:hypothetical protein
MNLRFVISQMSEDLMSRKHSEFLIGGGGGVDPEAIYELCLILKITL